MKRLNPLQEDVGKAKHDIMNLENDKAEKLFVENEFKKVQKDLDTLNDWCARLEDLIQKLSNTNNNQQLPKMSQRMDKLEDLLARLQKQLEELRAMKTLTSGSTVNVDDA